MRVEDLGFGVEGLGYHVFPQLRKSSMSVGFGVQGVGSCARSDTQLDSAEPAGRMVANPYTPNFLFFFASQPGVG